MSTEEEKYIEIGNKLEEAIKSQFFGKSCYKIGGKAFISFFQGEMVFKLMGDTHALALSLSGAKPFDPSAKGRAMKEWVQVPSAHVDLWYSLAQSAMKNVAQK